MAAQLDEHAVWDGQSQVVPGMHEPSASAPLDDATDQMMPDERLAADCLDGTDPAAWDRLLGRYSWLIQTVIRRYRLSPEDEADVYQDVCLACWRELPRLRDRSRIGRWIATVAGHRALDARRRLRPSMVQLLPVEDDEETPMQEWIADTSPGPEEVATRGEIVDRVRAAVLQLPLHQRELMTALFFEEGSYAEIAARLGYSIDSIGALRGRCFRALQRTLADLEGR
jgi:RNA polymerase sigma factor (sigma-70 family)